MKVCVTGVAGLIGSNIAKALLIKGHKVVGVDRLYSGYVDNVPVEVELHEANVMDFYSMKSALCRCDMVIHCAALPYEGVSVFSPYLVADTIYGGTLSVASAAIANKVKRFINCSSMARYGAQTPPFTEDMPCYPVDPYGAAKLHAEQQLEILSKVHGLHYTTVVPHNVAGPGQIYTDPYRNVLSIFANQLLRGLPIYIYGDGQQQRSFSHIDDCVTAMLKLIELEVIPSGKVFNIGPSDGTQTSILQLAEMVAAEVGAKLEINWMPPRPCEVKNAWVSTRKAELWLDYRAEKDLKTIIQDTVGWIKKRGPRAFNYHIDLEIGGDTTPKTWTGELFNGQDAVAVPYAGSA